MSKSPETIEEHEELVKWYVYMSCSIVGLMDSRTAASYLRLAQHHMQCAKILRGLKEMHGA
jgi:hypothetical protein